MKIVYGICGQPKFFPIIRVKGCKEINLGLLMLRDMRTVKWKYKVVERNVWEIMTDKGNIQTELWHWEKKKEVPLSSLMHAVLSHNCIYNFGKLSNISLAKRAVCGLQNLYSSPLVIRWWNQGQWDGAFSMHARHAIQYNTIHAKCIQKTGRDNLGDLEIDGKVIQSDYKNTIVHMESEKIYCSQFAAIKNVLHNHLILYAYKIQWACSFSGNGQVWKFNLKWNCWMYCIFNRLAATN